MTMSSRVLTIAGIVLCVFAVTMPAGALPAAATVTPSTTTQIHPQQSQPPVEGEGDIDPSDLPGDGSESNPYEISNVSELQAMEGDLDANYELVNDIDASQTPQFNDGRGFDPVGSFSESPAQPFRGSLDGNNNTVTGLTITRPSDSGIGLFGFTGSEATLRNITLTGVNTTGDTAVGGLVGSNSGTVADARASGDVTGEMIVGGLVGFNNGTTANGIIRTARASVSVIGGEGPVGGLVGVNRQGVIQTARASGSVSGDMGGSVSVGGLVGFNNGTVQTARASGSVIGRDNVGGLVGQNGVGNDDVEIRDTFAAGSITGETAVGGLVGRNFATVEQSYFDTQATGQTTSDGDATGLTTDEMQGQAARTNMSRFDFDTTWTTTSEYPALRALSEADEGSGGDDGAIQVDVSPSDLPGEGSESNPYEISNVSELQAMEDDLDANYELASDIDASQTARFNDGRGFDPIGGSFDESTPPAFSGSLDGNNHTLTELTITRPSESVVGLFGATDEAVIRDVTLTDVTVTGNEDVGGVVGSNAGTIQTVTASVSVNGRGSGNGNVGALAGNNFEGGTIRTTTVSGSVNASGNVGGIVGFNFDGAVRNVSALGSVSGSINVGGVVGANNGLSDEGTIRDTFATGSVSGDRNVGGVVGDNRDNGTVEQSYFDTEATGLSTSAGNATGLSTAEMQGTGAAQNMALAFGETWQTVSGDYPELIALTDSDADSNSETDTDLVAEYAGEDDTVGPFDVITAIDDFRQQQLGPFEVLAIIQAFRN